MVIYLLLAQDLPAKALEAIDKIRRGFLWKGRKDVKGGHCLIAWPKVTRPPDLGGLGISHLQFLGWALKLRWLWLQKTEPDKPWAFLSVQAPSQVKAFFLYPLSQWWEMERIPYFGQIDGCLGKDWIRHSLTCLGQWQREQRKEQYMMH